MGVYWTRPGVAGVSIVLTGRTAMRRSGVRRIFSFDVANVACCCSICLRGGASGLQQGFLTLIWVNRRNVPAY